MISHFYQWTKKWRSVSVDQWEWLMKVSKLRIVNFGYEDFRAIQTLTKLCLSEFQLKSFFYTIYTIYF